MITFSRSFGLQRTAACFLLALVTLAPHALANPPDLTAGGTRVNSAKGKGKGNGDSNLGPTGMRGWIYHENAWTGKSRQILVTEVHAGSPADGILAADDVILGASGSGTAPKPFSDDARKSIAYAIADAEARKPAALQLLRWRAGKTETVKITLQHLGAYSVTAPYKCPKSAAILEMGLQKMMAGESSGLFSLGSLALLAADDPSKPDNAARQTRAHNEIQSLIPTAGQMAKMNTPNLRGDEPTPWAAGHTLIILCEYYLKTNDPVVLPAIDAYVNVVQKGQSPFGSMGHAYAGSWPDGSPNGPIGGYGAVNSSALPALLGLQMAKKCGRKHPKLDAGIERGSRFFASYAGKGSIPYGEHMPGEAHSSNGKSGTAALVFEFQPERIFARDYFTKMTTASASEREGGHTGHGFNALWSALGAAVGGDEAVASYFSRASWYLDMCRRWDGSFSYDHLGSGIMGYRSHWRGFNMSTAVLLTYALPYRNLHITGKGRDPKGCLSPDQVAMAHLADSYSPSSRSTSQLIADLSSFSSRMRTGTCSELAARTDEKEKILTELIRIAGDLKNPARVGACEAMGYIGDTRTVPILVSLLSDEDNNVRYFSAIALLRFPQQVLFPMVNEILATAARNARPSLPLDEEDPGQFANGMLIRLLFNNSGQPNRMGILKDSLDGIDRNYLYPAIRMAAKHPLSGVNSTMKKIYSMLNDEDCIALADLLVDTVYYRSLGDTMFATMIRTSGLEAMEKRKVAEAVPLAQVVGGKQSFDVLRRYGASTALVEPNPRTVDFLRQFWVRDEPDNTNLWTSASATIQAITTDTNPVAPIPFKGIRSATADNATLTLPSDWTTLRVDAYDHAKGDSRFTWRKIHGRGEVHFAPNGNAESKNCVVLFDGAPGKYLFEVTMSDSRALTEVRQTVAVTLLPSGGKLPSNQAPAATSQAMKIAEATPTPITLLAKDPDGFPLTYQITTLPTHGALTGTAPYLVYTPAYGHTGADSFSFEVMDSEGQVASAKIDITVGPAAPTGLAVYEPFDYPSGPLNGQSSTSDVGFAGPWSAAAHVQENSLTYGPLPAKGGKMVGWNSNNRFGGSRSISPSALADSGLLQDGATLWMSVMLGHTPDQDGSLLLLALANGPFSNKDGQAFIPDLGSQAGEGLGITLSYKSKGYVGVASYGNALETIKAEVMNSWEAERYYKGRYGLVVAKVTWGATPEDPDRIELYQPDSAMQLMARPIASISAKVDQSKFNTLTWYHKNAPLVDEIRIGADYRSVLIGSVPATADTAPPSPNPIAFHSAPAPAGADSVCMVAAGAFDPSGVEYYFSSISGGGKDSGWQSSPEYTDTGLKPGGTYSYTVKARDLSLAKNETAPSKASSVTLPAKTKVPVVLGISKDAAQILITARGLKLGSITTAPSSSVGKGGVVKQSPSANATVSTGSAVDLVLSETILLATVPDLTGQNREAAETALAAMDLEIGKRFTDYSETVSAGQIKGTNPPAGKQIVPGSTVDLLISAGSMSKLLAPTTLFSEDFEEPSTPNAFVEGSVPDGGKWIRSRAGSRGITDKASGDFTAPDPNHQAFAMRKKDSGITTAEGVIGKVSANTRYTLSFDVMRDGSQDPGTSYICELIAFAPGTPRDRGETNRLGPTIASAHGEAPTDGSVKRVSFQFTAAPDSPHIGNDIAIRIVSGGSNHTNALIDNIRLDAVGVPLEDTVPPRIASMNPSHESAGMNVSDELSITFSEGVISGPGILTLRNVTDGTQEFLIAADPSAVTSSGNTIRLHPRGGLLPGKEYSVMVSPSAITDIAGNGFIGISDAAVWNFRTSSAR